MTGSVLDGEYVVQDARLLGCILPTIGRQANLSQLPNIDNVCGPVLIQPQGTKPAGISILLQIVALILECPAVLWGLFCVYGAAFPGPCGDDPGPGLGVLESWALDVPVGFLALAIGLFVKKGSPRLRWICIVTSIVTLSLPVIATFLLQRRHCP